MAVTKKATTKATTSTVQKLKQKQLNQKHFLKQIQFYVDL